MAFFLPRSSSNVYTSRKTLIAEGYEAFSLVMGVVKRLAPIAFKEGECCELPPISEIFEDISAVHSNVNELRGQLVMNKNELQEFIGRMRTLIEKFDYQSIVKVQKECKTMSDFTNEIRLRMIKHDSIDIQNNSDVYLTELIPPTWFEFKREGPKYCVHCECVDTIEWRNGPWGRATLCNACGLWYRKLSKKFTVEQSAIIMEEKRLFSNKHNRKELAKFNIDEKRLQTIKRSLIKRINKFVQEVELCNSTITRLNQMKSNQKVTPLDMNKYDSTSRIC